MCRADQACGNLTGDNDQRDGIHEGIRNAGNGIGRARTRGHQDHAGLAGRAGIAFRRVGRTSFMPDQNVANALFSKESVVNWQHRAAGIAENIFDPLADQAFDQDACSVTLFTHRNYPSLGSPQPLKEPTRHSCLCRVAL